MNITMFYPEFPETFWSFKHALKYVQKKASSPPLGLLTVAAMLPAEWTIRLVDLNVRKLKAKDLAKADFAFISAMTVQKASAIRLIARCKEAGVKIVAGGPLFTAEHELFDAVDHLVLNEAELTLPDFLRDLDHGCARRIYASSEFADLHETPIPRWDLLDMERYATMSVQFSRGCPFNCDFCNVTALLGHVPRTKSADQIVRELDTLYRAGWRRGVFFVDDNLIGNKKQLRDELLPSIIEWRNRKRGFSFTTEASINLADDEPLMRLMVKAGFNRVFVGIETPDEDSLTECSKKQNLNRNLIDDVKRIQNSGMEVLGGFIVGFDNDTPLIFQRLLDFIEKSRIVTAMVGLLQAPPGTALYKRLLESGRLHDRMSGDNVDGSTNIVPIMNLETLRTGYRNLMHHIYSAEVFYQRVKAFLADYRPPKIPAPRNIGYFLEQSLAFIRSIVFLGMMGKERVYYWKLFFWALVKRPVVFPLAITFAIHGAHFRRVCGIRLAIPQKWPG